MYINPLTSPPPEEHVVIEQNSKTNILRWNYTLIFHRLQRKKENINTDNLELKLKEDHRVNV